MDTNKIDKINIDLITKDNLKINENEFSVPQGLSSPSVSDSPFNEFQSKSVLRSTLPLTDNEQATPVVYHFEVNPKVDQGSFGVP